MTIKHLAPGGPCCADGPPVDVTTWRLCRLRESGFPQDLAQRLASTRAVDIHALAPAGRPRLPSRARGQDPVAHRDVGRVTVSRVGADDRVPPDLDLPDTEPENWVEALSTPGPRQDHAMDRLHQMMLRASRHQVRRMRSTLAGVGDERLDEIANQAADEAMMAVLAKLSTFEGRSRFTTWAYKFAILQSATEVRRFAWQHREVELDDNAQLQAHSPIPGQLC